MIIEGKVIVNTIKRKTKSKGEVTSEIVLINIPKIILKNIGFNKDIHKKYKLWLNGKVINIRLQKVEGDD